MRIIVEISSGEPLVNDIVAINLIEFALKEIYKIPYTVTPHTCKLTEAQAEKILGIAENNCQRYEEKNGYMIRINKIEAIRELKQQGLIAEEAKDKEGNDTVKYLHSGQIETQINLFKEAI